MLTVLHTWRRLTLQRPGRLVPWLGRALRGLIARQLKRHSCRQAPAEQETTWRYCRGCPHMAGCAHGQTFEADPPGDRFRFAGQDDAARPLVLASEFPLPPRARPGQTLGVRVTFVGADAIPHAHSFWQAAAVAGLDPDAGLGPDHIPFTLDLPPAPAPAHLAETVHLPGHADAFPSGTARLRLELTGPLILRSSGADGQRRRLLTRPSFGDLFNACLRTLGPLCRLYGQEVPDEAFGLLKQRAALVPTLQTAYRPFTQPAWSNRGEQHGQVQAIVGAAEFADVPDALLVWLAWGGRLHVGTWRVAGAGGWCLRAGQADGSWAELA